MQPEMEAEASPQDVMQRDLISFEHHSSAEDHTTASHVDNTVPATTEDAAAAAAANSFTNATNPDRQLDAAEKHEEAFVPANEANNSLFGDDLFGAAFQAELNTAAAVDMQSACCATSVEQRASSINFLKLGDVQTAHLLLPVEEEPEQRGGSNIDNHESVSQSEPSSSHTAKTSSSPLLECQARIAALEQENAQLAEKLMRLELDRIEFMTAKLKERPQTPSDVIAAWVCGDEIARNSSRLSLQRFRSLQDKQRLLSKAVCWCDPDVLLAVILFLRDTQMPKLFLKTLCAHEFAVQAYRKYLEEQDALPQLAALHKYQQDTRSEALLMIKCAYRMTEPAQRLQALQDASVFLGRASSAELEFEREAIKQDMELLQVQAKMEEFDSRMEASAQEPMFQQHKRPSLKFATVRNTLYYCFFFHPYVPDHKLSQANIVREQLSVSDQMYTWMQLLARAQLQDWDSVASIPTVKGMIYKKATTPIGFSPFVEVVTWFNGPMELRARFAESMTDPEQKYLVCSRCRLHQPAIQALLALESKEMLLRYRVQILGENALERDIQTIDDAIADPRRKWKSRPELHNKWRPLL